MDIAKNAKSWANFFMCEKLALEDTDEPYRSWIALLVMEAAQYRPPKHGGMYKERLETRAFICKLAMALEIDLTAIKRRGKMAMGRGLLDAWTKAYTEEFGSAEHTAAEREQKRRDIKTKLKGLSNAVHSHNEGQG